MRSKRTGVCLWLAASPVLDPDAGLDHRRALTKGQVALGRRGREVAAAALQAAIDQTISPGLSWEEWTRRLAACGVEPVPVRRASGRVTGMAWRHVPTGVVMPGYRLGRAYTWPRLLARGVSDDRGERPAADSGADPAPGGAASPRAGFGEGGGGSASDAAGPSAGRTSGEAGGASEDLATARALEALVATAEALGGRIEVWAKPGSAVAPEGAKRQRRVIRAAEASRFVLWVRALSARGYDLFVGPTQRAGGRWHGVVLIEGVTAKALAQVQAEAAPVLVVATAPGRHQVWVRVAETLDGKTAAPWARTLAARYGGDPAAEAACQAGRLPGLIEKERKGYAAAPPCCRIIALGDQRISPLAKQLAPRVAAGNSAPLPSSEKGQTSAPHPTPTVTQTLPPLARRKGAQGENRSPLKAPQRTHVLAKVRGLGRDPLRRGDTPADGPDWAARARVRCEEHKALVAHVMRGASTVLRGTHQAGQSWCAQGKTVTRRARTVLADGRVAAACKRAGLWWDAEQGMIRVKAATPEAALLTLLVWRYVGVTDITADPPEWAALLREKAEANTLPVHILDPPCADEPPQAEFRP